MTAVKISICLPTRQRPLLCRRFLNSIIDTCNDLNNIEVIIYVDTDDATWKELDTKGIKSKLLRGPQSTMGYYNSVCSGNAQGEIIILANDDVIIRTKGWDSQLTNLHSQIKDGIYLFYPNDLFQGSSLCTFPIMSRKTLNILIDPFPFRYKRAFIDLHLFDIFKRLKKLGYNRCYYLPNLVFEHCHFQNGKSNYDDVYKMREIIKFDDDREFLDLASFRQECAVNLASEIALNDYCDPLNVSARLNVASEDVSFCPKAKKSYVLTNSVLSIFLDYGIPFPWRIYLVNKFLLRSIVRFIGYNHKWYKWRRLV